MSKLIQALQILLKYGDPEYPTHCEHDELSICGIKPSMVTDDDKIKLDKLGFFVTESEYVNGDEFFMSFKYGSA